MQAYKILNKQHQILHYSWAHKHNTNKDRNNLIQYIAIWNGSIRWHGSNRINNQSNHLLTSCNSLAVSTHCMWQTEAWKCCKYDTYIIELLKAFCNQTVIFNSWDYVYRNCCYGSPEITRVKNIAMADFQKDHRKCKGKASKYRYQYAKALRWL